MSETSRWSFPTELQPTADAVAFDLRTSLDAVVALRAEIPDDAFTAPILGTERVGSGVVIRDSRVTGSTSSTKHCSRRRRIPSGAAPRWSIPRAC